MNLTLEALNKNSLDMFNDNQFVDILKKIYDTIHDIRCSVMMIRVSLLYLPLNYCKTLHHLECLEWLQEVFYLYAIMSMLKSVWTLEIHVHPQSQITVTKNTFTYVFSYNLCKWAHLTIVFRNDRICHMQDSWRCHIAWSRAKENYIK